MISSVHLGHFKYTKTYATCLICKNKIFQVVFALYIVDPFMPCHYCHMHSNLLHPKVATMAGTFSIFKALHTNVLQTPQLTYWQQIGYFLLTIQLVQCKSMATVSMVVYIEIVHFQSFPTLNQVCQSIWQPRLTQTHTIKQKDKKTDENYTES